MTTNPQDLDALVERMRDWAEYDAGRLMECAIAAITILRRDLIAAEAAATERAAYERGKAESLNSLPPSFAILIIEAMAEAEKAMRKFPQPNYVISKFAEEAGEVVKAAIHHAEDRETREAVVGEMRQVLAMMLRLWIEGDQVHGMKPLALLTQEGR